MIPGSGSYLVGLGALLAITAALGLGGFELRRWLAPEFSGALARLAELVLAASMLVMTLQLLGSFGLLRTAPVTAACIAVGCGAALLGRSKADRTAVAAPLPTVPAWALVVAITVAAVTVAEWSIPTRLNLHQGIFSGDSTWYHMPFAARFAQTHSTWNLQFTDPLRLATWFYPASSELLGSLGIVLFHSDWLMPLTNLGWLALGLLAAFCVGRPYGVGPATLVAGAIALDSGVLLATQAGDARNDSMAVALLVAFAALLVNSDALAGAGSGARLPAGTRAAPLPRGPLIIAGLAGGLAISVKLTMLPAVVVITLVAIGLARPGRRLETAGLLTVSELASGGYWYLRNLAHSGNPVPEVHSLGPIALPHPNQMGLYPRRPSSVAHYLTDWHVIRTGFLPQLDKAFGPLYPLVLGIGLAAAIYAVVASRGTAPKALAIGALVAGAVYLVTPLTAAGPPGEPHGFFTNLRYFVPALALGLLLFPLASPLLRSSRRIGVSLSLLAAIFAAGLIGTSHWPFGYLPGAALVALVLIVIPTAATLAPDRIPRVAIAVAAVVVVVAGAIAGRRAEVGYAEHHYSPKIIAAQAAGGPVRTFAWAQRLRHERIAVAGGGELFFAQYLFYGADLTNWVQYIGKPGPHGQYTVPPSCAVLRHQIDRGHYDYLVLTKWGDDASDRKKYPIRAWTLHTRGLRQVRREDVQGQTVYTYRLTGRLSVAGCPAAAAARS